MVRVSHPIPTYERPAVPEDQPRLTCKAIRYETKQRYRIPYQSATYKSQRMLNGGVC